MERCRLTNSQEKSVETFLKETPAENGLIGILENINKKSDEHVLYYSGGLRALGQLLTDSNWYNGVVFNLYLFKKYLYLAQQRTLFRVQNGFNILEEHPIISKYIKYPVSIFELNTMEIDLITSIFELLQIAVVNCGKLLIAIKIDSIKYLNLKLIAQAKTSTVSLR